MKENPYSKLLEMTKGQKETRDNVMIGAVISSNPLIITSGELQIYNDDILIADYLVDGYKRDYRTNRHIPNGSDSGTMTYTEGINVGDQLAMLQTADRQLYIIIARVKEV